MPLEAIDKKIEEFRTLSGDELKQAIYRLCQSKQPTLNKKEKRILSGLNLGNMRFVMYRFTSFSSEMGLLPSLCY